MTHYKIKMDNPGLRSYLSAADELFQELRSSKMAEVADLFIHDEIIRSVMMSGMAVRPVPCILLVNSYQIFLAGCRTALSGHPAAILPLQRAALESAAFGLMIELEPDLEQIWLERDSTKAAKKECREHFTFGKVMWKLKKKFPQICELAQEAYEDAISLGAHPNVNSVAPYLRMNAMEDGWNQINHASVYLSDHRFTKWGIRTCVRYAQIIVSLMMCASTKSEEKWLNLKQKMEEMPHASVDLEDGDAASEL